MDRNEFVQVACSFLVLAERAIYQACEKDAPDPTVEEVRHFLNTMRDLVITIERGIVNAEVIEKGIVDD